jgi:hypothetical protein
MACYCTDITKRLNVLLIYDRSIRSDYREMAEVEEKYVRGIQSTCQVLVRIRNTDFSISPACAHTTKISEENLKLN